MQLDFEANNLFLIWFVKVIDFSILSKLHYEVDFQRLSFLLGANHDSQYELRPRTECNR